MRFLESELLPYDQVIPLDSLNTSLLATACACPGYAPLFFSMTCSLDVVGPEGHWLNEYCAGLSYELYQIPVPPTASGYLFDRFATMMYRLHGMTVIAVKTIRATLDAAIYVFPELYTIKSNDMVFVMAVDALAASRISETPESDLPSLKVDSERRTRNMTILKKTSSAVLRLMPSGNQLQREESEEYAYPSNHSPAGVHTPGQNRSMDEHTPLGEQGRLKSIHTGAGGPLFNIHRKDAHVNFSNHVVICGRLQDLSAFIKVYEKLVRKARSHTFVILDPDHNNPLGSSPGRKDSDERMDPRLVRNDIHFIEGDPTNAKDLRRACVEAASVVIITRVSNGADNYDEPGHLADSKQILTWQMVKNMVSPTTRILVELFDATTSSLCIQRLDLDIVGGESSTHLRMYEKDGLFSQEFASGRVYPRSILSFIACQAYYEPALLPLLKQLVYSSKEDKSSGLRQRARLTFVAVPPKYDGRTYGDIFPKVVNDGYLPIGLYRLQHGVRYAFANGEPSTVLSARDYLYVFASLNGGRRASADWTESSEDEYDGSNVVTVNTETLTAGTDEEERTYTGTDGTDSDDSGPSEQSSLKTGKKVWKKDWFSRK
eukprot:GFYU01004414.1.p1 GENE.GFYU01004414.1~~GFYU01004414.1.p1  ORF type:complete len:704 (+),score=164.15 GFYU01004414.1:306-2114(+)